MGKLIGIGGGVNGGGFSPQIERWIVEQLQGVERPRIVYLPQAAEEESQAQQYEAFQAFYQQEFGLATEVLRLTAESTAADVEEKLLHADLIYVGGGSTLRLVDELKRHGVWELLRKAYEKGSLLAGFSAGANLWFEHGLSAEQVEGEPVVLSVDGYGFAAGRVCTHFNYDNRAEAFREQVKLAGTWGFGLEDHVAVVYEAGEMMFLAGEEGAQAHLVFVDKRGDVKTAGIELRRWMRLGEVLKGWVM
ncbi:MAG TPA: Type 1 glutamine amidotransferase-like domain-containing protein [Bacilli bacterium]|nr:Type 1 glutamine amidotransferase-like domain-containing protein [Bacilli bacterium]